MQRSIYGHSREWSAATRVDLETHPNAKFVLCDRNTAINTYHDWRLSRRRLLQIGAMATAGSFGAGACASEDGPIAPEALAEFGYGAVTMASEAHEAQLRNTQSVLMSLSDDSLLMPFRQMAGLPAPGVELGGWYAYRPNYHYRKNFDEGTAALVRGPLALMALKPDLDAPAPVLSRSALLNASRAAAAEWRADAAGGPVVLTPVTALGARPYNSLP
jgi:hypothetical protein